MDGALASLIRSYTLITVREENHDVTLVVKLCALEASKHSVALEEPIALQTFFHFLDYSFSSSVYCFVILASSLSSQFHVLVARHSHLDEQHPQKASQKDEQTQAP
jgi:hypothetical protein